MSLRPLVIALLTTLLPACAARPPAAPVAPAVPTIAAAWVAEHMPGEEIDSVAAWRADAGSVLVLATAKVSQRVVLLDADDGRRIGEIGGAPGDGVHFGAPNGIAVAGDLAFVVERDGRRVQVLDLRSRVSLGAFGEGVLRRPFGLWVLAHGPGHFQVYVTDSYDASARVAGEGVEGRVKRFAVRIARGVLDAELETAFGGTEGEGGLHWVESIWGDPVHNRLLVADEHPEYRDIKVYDLGGRYTGQTLGQGLFVGEPEGIALVECAGGSGYWLVSDQHRERQSFRVFDRRTLGEVGIFRSDDARMVDGIWFQREGTGQFPEGVMYSQHDDLSVVAFDWRSIREALHLPDGC
jgi:3-phytase